MSFEVGGTTRERPEFSTVARFEIRRLEENPQVRAEYAETIRRFEEPVMVEEAIDANSDTLFEKIVVLAWVGRTDIKPGRKLFLASDVVAPVQKVITEVGVVESFDSTSGTVTLVENLTENLTGVELVIEKFNKFGSTLLREARGGRRHRNHMDSSQVDDLMRMSQMLGEVYFYAAKHWLLEIGETGYTDADIQAVVQSLANKGVNIEGLIVESLERVEKDRRDGTFVPAIVELIKGDDLPTAA